MLNVIEAVQARHFGVNRENRRYHQVAAFLSPQE